MSTTRELVFRLHRLLDGGDIPDDTRFTYRELRGYVISGIAQAMKEFAFEQYNNSDFAYGSDEYGKTIPITVQVDEDGNYYSPIENKTVAFGGMRNNSISPKNPFSRWAKTFVPIRSEEAFLQKFQANIPDVIQFTINDGKIYFINGLIEEGTELNLTQKYVLPNPDSTDDDVQLDLPSEYENVIIDQAHRLVMREIINEDRANDGVPNIN